MAQGGGGRILGGIQKGDQPHQGELALIGHAVAALAQGDLLVGHGNHPQAIVIEALVELQHLLALLRTERQGLITQPQLLTDRQDFFDGALADQLMVVIGFFHHHRQAAPQKIKGNFVDFAEGAIHLQAVLQISVG